MGAVGCTSLIQPLVMGLVTVRVSYTPSYPPFATMTAFWRAAGLNYVHYSAIAARTTRAALKPKLQESAAKREIKTISSRPGRMGNLWEQRKPCKKASASNL